MLGLGERYEGHETKLRLYENFLRQVLEGEGGRRKRAREGAPTPPLLPPPAAACHRRLLPDFDPRCRLPEPPLPVTACRC